MKNTHLHILLRDLISDPMVKKISITDWKECGEYSGQDPRPIIEIEKWDNLTGFEKFAKDCQNKLSKSLVKKE